MEIQQLIMNDLGTKLQHSIMKDFSAKLQLIMNDFGTQLQQLIMNIL